jgi:host factor-I protein
LQDAYLAAARRREVPVTVFLMNGFQMRGTITGYDPFTVVLTADGKQNLIYKHAISTISPLKPLELLEEEAAT